jgi:hypothetical protein
MSDFIGGLDLGQASDYTALAILRRDPVLNKAGEILKNHRGRTVYDFACLHLERFPLGTPYPAIVHSVKALMERPELESSPRLAIDATGVGRAVVDMVIDADIAANVSPVTITGGNADFRREPWHEHYGPGAYWVAKLHLIGTVQAALSSGRLKIAPKLAFAEILRRELLDYRVKLTAAANETFEAREGAHDDLLLATAIAVWIGTEAYSPNYTLGEAITIPRLPGKPNAIDRMYGGHRPRSIYSRQHEWQGGGLVSPNVTEEQWRTGRGRLPYRPPMDFE